MRINGVVTAGGKVPPNPPTNVIFNNLSIGRPYNDGAILVTFTPSANQGKYPASYTVGTSGLPMTITGSSSPITLTGLPSNYFTTPFIYASNTWGQSSVVTGSGIGTATVPNSPSIGTATATGSTTASVAFGVTEDGGSAITGYTVTSSPGGLTGTGTSSPITVAGLTAGTAYTFTVTATNANGTSLASAASNSVTPSVSFFAYLATTTAYYGSCVTSDGIYTVGLAGATTTGQVLITRFNFDGSVNWQRTLSKTLQFDAGYAIVADSSGNVYAFGQYYKDATDTAMSFIAKYNSSGTLQYQKMLDLGAPSERILSAKITSSGDIYASGGHTLSGVNRVSVLKLNTTPTVSWARTWSEGLTGDGTGASITNRGLALDSSDNSYTLINALGGVDPDQYNNFQIAKYNSSGTVQAGGKYDSGSFGGTRYASAIASDGTDIYIGGNAGGGTYLTKLTSSITTTTWSRSLNIGSRIVEGITCSSTGDIYMLSTQSASSDQRILIFKYNSSGTLQWQRRIDITTPASNSQNAYSLSLDETKQRLIITGRIVANVFVASLPIDGSGTGTYTLGSYTVTYDIPSVTSSTYSFGNLTAQTATNTDRTATVADSNMFDETPSFTANKVTF